MKCTITLEVEDSHDYEEDTASALVTIAEMIRGGYSSGQLTTGEWWDFSTE